MIGLNWPRKTGSGGLLHFENGFVIEEVEEGAVEVKIIENIFIVQWSLENLLY